MLLFCRQHLRTYLKGYTLSSKQLCAARAYGLRHICNPVYACPFAACESHMLPGHQRGAPALFLACQVTEASMSASPLLSRTHPLRALCLGLQPSQVKHGVRSWLIAGYCHICSPTRTHNCTSCPHIPSSAVITIPLGSSRTQTQRKLRHKP